MHLDTRMLILRKPRPSVLAALILAAFIASVGVGHAASTNRAATINAQKLPSVKMACSRSVMQVQLWNLAPFAEKYGITTECVEFNTFGESLQALAKGDLDTGLVGVYQAAQLLDQGYDNFRIVAGYATAGAQIVVRTGANVQTWADLAGKTVCLPPATGAEALFKIGALANKLDLNTVKVLPAGFVPAIAIQGLQDGSCDALIMWSPIVDQAVVSGIAHYAVPKLDVFGPWIGAQNGVLVAGPKLLKRPKILVALLKGYADSLNYLKTHPKVWAQQAAVLGGTTAPVIKESMKHLDINYGVDLRAIQRAARFAKTIGLTKSEVTNAQMAKLVNITYLSRATGKKPSTLLKPVTLGARK